MGSTPNVSFTPWYGFDSGRYPSIAVNARGTIISGHQREGTSAIYYNVGAAGLNGPSINPVGTEFDSGAPPRMAINDNDVALEIHKSNGPSDNLWYHAGTVDPDGRTWDHGDSHEDGNGQDPDIGLNNANQVVAVHEKDGTVYVRSGMLDTSNMEIDFETTLTVAEGYRPTVAINNRGNVIVVYRSKAYGNLQCWQGQMNYGVVRNISSGWAASGDNPSVGLCDDGFVLLGYAYDGGMYTTAGQVSASSVSWTPALQYAYGDHPWVDCQGSWAVQSYPSDDLADFTLYASSCKIWDRANWMEKAAYQSRSLKRLVLPGAHDAGMSTHQACTLDGTQCNTRTQFVDIGLQLQGGCRYFDIRPVWYNNEYWTGHYADTGIPGIGIQGCNGQKLDQILDQTRTFLQGTSHEVAILKFSHYYDKSADRLCFSKSRLEDLMSYVEDRLDGYLYINDTGMGLTDIPIGTITASGSKAIAVFQFVPNRAVSSDASKPCTCVDASGPQCGPEYATADPTRGLYGYADYCPACPVAADLTVYDQYSATNDLDAMISNQWQKQANTANHGGDLFLLSWTLTQSGTQATACGVTWLDSIVAIADTADCKLFSEVASRFDNHEISQATIPNVLYVDLCNGFATDVAVWLNDRL